MFIIKNLYNPITDKKKKNIQLFSKKLFYAAIKTKHFKFPND